MATKRRQLKIIGIGLSKRSLPSAKRDSRKAGFCGVTSRKEGKWHSLYYTHRKKRGKC